MSRGLSFAVACVLLTDLSFAQSETTASPIKAATPLSARSADEILKRYQFVSDFTAKAAEREISSEYFWRYPFPLPKAEFEINHELGSGPDEMPATIGAKRPVQHLNYGRILFLRGEHDHARRVWLAARARFGTEYDFHRRADYFIALAYMRASRDILKQFHGQINKPEVRLSYSNTATFLSWAFTKKRDIPDPALDVITPRALYNLAAIYYQFDRYNGAHATAESALNFLRRTGRKDRRPELRRIVAETWIRDRQYLRAVRELDTMIRQERNHRQAALAFSRVGDIYFDLNNYEMAEYSYALSQGVFRSIDGLLPMSFILRGESLFWLGRFEEAQQALHFGIEAVNHRFAMSQASPAFRAWAALRIADAFLARSEALSDTARKDERAELREQAQLAYYRVAHKYPRSEAARIARLRRACISLPDARGANVMHARKTLEAARSDSLPLQAIEYAWRCEILSYKERDESFVARVRAFYEQFPHSRYLPDYVLPLVEVRARHFDEAVAKGRYSEAVAFYEQHREKLFGELSQKRRRALFLSYVRTGQSAMAAQHWRDSDLEQVRTQARFLWTATFLAEMDHSSPEAGYDRAAEELLASSTPKADAWTLSLSAANVLGMQRILATRDAPRHYRWMLALSAHNAGEDPQVLCEQVNPLLMSLYRATRDDSDAQAFVWREVQAASEKWLPELFSRSLTCSQALLDLEHELGLNPEHLGSYVRSWQKRIDWPQRPLFVPHLWATVEAATERFPKEVAPLRTFLEGLDAKVFPESRYARAASLANDTEIEGLWRSTAP